MKPTSNQLTDKQHRRKKKITSKEQNNNFKRQQSSAPINALPYDVLSDIFKELREIDVHFLPTKLGAVCAFWRQVAWSTPFLWTELELNNQFWWCRSRDYLLDLYLRNIGGLIMDLVIYDYPSDLEVGRPNKKRRGKRSTTRNAMAERFDPFTEFEDNPFFPATEVFQTIFVRHPNKLKSVVLGIYVHSWLLEIEQLSESGAFTHLEAFAITSDDGDYPFLSSDDLSYPPITLHKVPKLDAVLLMGPRNRFIFPWTQLHSLQLSNVDAAHAMHVFLQCINLQDFSVAQLEEEFIGDIIFPRERVVLNQLKSFRYSDFAVPFSWEIALPDYLAFPTLEVLVLEAAPLTFGRHGDFLRNLPPTLTGLDVVCDGTRGSTNTFIELFTRLHSLKTLCITFLDSIPLELLKQLTAKPHRQILLPALKELTLSLALPGAAFGKKKFRALLELLRSRRGMRRPEGVEELCHFNLELHSQCPQNSILTWPDNFKIGIAELTTDGLGVRMVALDRPVTASLL